MSIHPVIFHHGMDAYDRGTPRDRNPYHERKTPDEILKYKSWQDGWLRARQIDQHDREEYRKEQET